MPQAFEDLSPPALLLRPPLLPPAHEELGSLPQSKLSLEDASWLASVPAGVVSPEPEFDLPPLEPEPEPEPEAPAVEKLSKAELNARIQKAFARGGEKAVLRLMKQLEAEGLA